MINWSGPQTQSPALAGFSALCSGGAPLFSDCRKTMADLQTGYQHATITSCHLYIFQLGTMILSPPPTAYDVMAHDIISFGTPNLPFLFFFCHTVDIYQVGQDYLWEGLHRDRIGSHTVGG